VHTGRRRPELPVIAAVLGVLALLAIVLITAGGDDGGSKGEGEGDRAEQVAPDSKSKSDRKSDSDSGSQTPAAPADPASPGADAAAGTPAATVNDFYQRAASGDYAGAWALATPRAREKLGGFAGFSQGQSSLESITFPKLKGKEKGDSATVDLRSQAVHSDRIDRCKGSIDLVRAGGAWMLDDFHIAGCTKTPR
jgi:hypothetical protein